jgi:hypothetical protein
MSEPKFGYKNLVKAKKEGKVRAFFNLLIPTESVGTIEIAGFKVVEGKDKPFISLPNRAVKAAGQQTINAETGEITESQADTKYYNNIRFDSQERYNEFRKELNDNVLPLILDRLTQMA